MTMKAMPSKRLNMNIAYSQPGFLMFLKVKGRQTPVWP